MIVPDDTMLMDGYEDCMVGMCIRFGQEPIATYSYEKIIKKLMDDGLSELDATEWFDYNIIDAWVGDKTPAFLVKEYEFE